MIHQARYISTCIPDRAWFVGALNHTKSNFWRWFAGLLGCALFGWWLARSAAQVDRRESTGKPAPEHAANKTIPAADPVRFKTARERIPDRRPDFDALAQGAVPGQRALQFHDRASMERFLAAAADRIRVLDRIDGWNALRIAFDDPDAIHDLLDGDNQPSFIYPVSAPPPPEGTVQPGAVALGGELRNWLGITGDTTGWGRGVTVAVLDTAVDTHPAITTAIRSIDLVGTSPPVEGGSRGHGTAVASVIAGAHPLVPGVAPAADLLSIRVADDRGISDSFQLAKGIHAALESGADLINISMGSQGNSGIVQRAVEAANAQGVLIIAAAGNNGTDRVTYPAANEGVIAVGAVDATGSHLAFSNTGQQIDIAAPGLGVNAAWSDGSAARVTGTSFSAPVITGTIAAVMTEAGSSPLSAAQAWQRIQSVLNESGAPGADPETGAGLPDLSRVFQNGTPGLFDAAVAGQRTLPATPSAPYGELETVLQNRGTETLINTAVMVSVDGRESRVNLTTMAPNEVKTIRVPLTVPMDQTPIQTSARVSLTAQQPDSKPSNDRWQITLPAAKP